MFEKTNAVSARLPLFFLYSWSNLRQCGILMPTRFAANEKIFEKKWNKDAGSFVLYTQDKRVGESK